MPPLMPVDEATEGRRGCGPLIPPLSDTLRPLRQQVFERVRAAGTIPRVQVAKDLGVSPASVTTITSELIEAGLIEEIAAAREGDQGRGRPAVLLGVRATAHRVAGMKLSDREHTAVIVDFAGNLIAFAMRRRHHGTAVTRRRTRSRCGAIARHRAWRVAPCLASIGAARPMNAGRCGVRW